MVPESPEPTDYRRKPQLPFFVWVLLIVLVALGACQLICQTLLNMNEGESLTVSTVVVVISGLSFTVMYALVMLIVRWVQREAVERTVMGHIANIFRQKLPLAPAMAVAARSEGGIASRNLRLMAAYLNAGASLSQAMREGWPGCPSIVLSLVIAGERAGQLPFAVEQANRFLTRRARRRQRVDVPVTPYAVVVTLITCLMTTGMMVAVVPKFKEIFKDFGTHLPALTVALIDVAEWTQILLAPIMLLLAMVFFVVVYCGFSPRSVPRPRMMSRVADWFRWHLPGLHRLELAQGMAVSLGAIGLGLRSGLDLPAAVQLAAETDVNYQVRLRLRRLARRLASGEDLRAATQALGLGTVAGIALASGRRSGDMSTALRYAIDYHDALFSRAWLIARRVAWPATTLALGCIVGFVVVAMFVPLVQLLDATIMVGRR